MRPRDGLLKITLKNNTNVTNNQNIKSDPMDFIPQRPKGMHRTTSNKIISEIKRLEDVGNAGVFAKYGFRI
jgi:hypothetical protein